jgi:hypothetical protein
MRVVERAWRVRYQPKEFFSPLFPSFAFALLISRNVCCADTQAVLLLESEVKQVEQTISTTEQHLTGIEVREQNAVESASN